MPTDGRLESPGPEAHSRPGSAAGERPGRIVRQRCRPDWPAIEADYRSGRHSLRQLAARHGCAPSTIANRATCDGWTRLATPDPGRRAGAAGGRRG